MYVFTSCTLPFHFGVYVAGHFANIITRKSTVREHTQHMCISGMDNLFKKACTV